MIVLKCAPCSGIQANEGHRDISYLLCGRSAQMNVITSRSYRELLLQATQFVRYLYGCCALKLFFAYFDLKSLVVCILSTNYFT